MLSVRVSSTEIDLYSYAADYNKRVKALPQKRPIADTIAFPRLSGDTDAAKLCQQIVNQAGVMLLPSTVYGYDNSHPRFGFGGKDMAETLNVLDRWLKQNKYR